MSLDATEFWHMAVPGHERVIVLLGLALPRRYHTLSRVGIRPPESDIALVRPAEDELAVRSPGYRETIDA